MKQHYDAGLMGTREQTFDIGSAVGGVGYRFDYTDLDFLRILEKVAGGSPRPGSVRTGQLYLDNITSTYMASVTWQRNNIPRWVTRMTNDAEAGSESGSFFEIRPYDDGGVDSIGFSLRLYRTSNRAVEIPGYLELGDTLDHNGTHVGFRGATPVPMPGVSDDIKATLQAIGIMNAGSGPTSLNTNGGILTGSSLVADGGSGAADIFINSSAGNTRLLYLTTNGSSRWRAGANATAEAGSDAGSDFEITRYDDSGSSLGVVMRLTRSTGRAYFANIVEIDGNLDHDGTSVGFRGATPVGIPGATDDIKDSLQAVGLLNSSNSATPLNLNGGALTAGRAVFDVLSADPGVNRALYSLFTSGSTSGRGGLIYRDDYTLQGGVRRMIYSAYASQDVTGTTSTYLDPGSANGTRTIPANWWRTGKAVKITLRGNYITGGTAGNVLTLDLRLGTTSLKTWNTRSLGTSVGETPFEATIWIRTISTFTSGTFMLTAMWTSPVPGLDNINETKIITTNADQDLRVYAKWNNSGCTFRLQDMEYEVSEL